MNTKSPSTLAAQSARRGLTRIDAVAAALWIGFAVFFFWMAHRPHYIIAERDEDREDT